MDIILTENEMKKCMSIYNNTKWNGNTMQIQLAKESFLTRLEQERAAACSEIKEDLIVRPKEKSPHQAAAEKRLKENFDKAGVSEFVVKGKVPGTQIEGEKNWIVGKYGRVLPVVYVRRKDKQKVVCCDPSKFSHHLKKFKKDDKVDEGIEMPKIEQLTWDIPEIHSEVSKKRKGIFSQERPLKLDRKKVKGDITLKIDLLPSNMLPEYKVKSSNLSQSDSDYDDIDEDAVTSIPSIDGHIQNIRGSKEQPTDFEIVRDGTSHISLSLRTNSSLFDSKPGYDSDDRESVDTDELCTLIRSTKNSSTVQTNGDLNKKETSKTLLPTEDQVARTIAVKRANQTKEEEKGGGGSNRNECENMGILRVHESLEVGESDSENEEEDSSLNSDYASNDELHKDSDEDEKNSDEDVIDDGHVPSLNFEPLILDRSYLQGHKNTKVLSKHHIEDEEDSSGDKEEENVHESDAGEEGSASQDNVDDVSEEEEEMLGSPIARFDFEPLILDREAIRMSMGVETKGDQTNIGCHTEDEKLGSDDNETNDNSDEEESSSGSSIESSDDEEDAPEDVNNSDSDDSSDGVSIKQINKSTDQEVKSNIFLEVETSATKQEVTKSRTGLEQKNDKLNQAMYDKSGRLLSKAAKKKLAREEAEKQKQANERRLESMKQQQRALLDRQGAIKGALSSVDDKEKKQGKHITFDSDDGESESDTGLNDETNFAGHKIQSSTSLFESDDDDESDDDEEEEDSLPENRVRKMWEDGDDEDDDGVDDERFKIKPQYEGEAGQKLIQMEARYGGDTRFKLDSRFLDRKDENAGSGFEGEGNEDGEDDLSSDLQEEKRRSLAILQNLLGTPVVTSSKAVEPNFKDPSQLHYDPSRDEHSKYELQEDDLEDESDAKKLEEDMRKEKRKMDEERSKLPEVSKEKFFQVSSNLKDAFSAGGMEENGDGGGTFTFFGGDNSDIEDELSRPENDEDLTAGLASSLFPSKRFKYDSSDEEDDDDDEVMDIDPKEVKSTETVKEEESKGMSVPQAFFFLPNDPRLTVGSQKFCRPKDQATMMTTWQEMKSQLQNDFRKRHQKAVRDQKTSKKWQKKPAKSKKL
ncbi:nucleolar protein 8-like isoform X2 [Lytechinus variegatus]|nr:nucleolar protein 8-like isoform X2 [Lytechinus variegatus]